MCSKCEQIPTKVYDPLLKNIVFMFHDIKTEQVNILIVQENDDKTIDAITVPISYCPWCGRKV